MLSLALVAVLNSSHRAFHLELDQRAHRDLAARLLSGSGEAALPDSVFSRVRELAILSPAIAAYTVEENGSISASSRPAAELARTHVEIDPILEFIKGPKTWPLMGDDPSAQGKKAIFSAAPLGRDKRYLYVVLGDADGALDEAAAERSYALREAVWLSLGNVAAALVAALLVVAAITRPVRRLREAMNAFESSNLEGSIRYGVRPARAAPNEIDQLGEIFDSMADRIAVQVDSLRRASEARREFYANVSHDLQTPLTSLHGYVQTLLMKDDILPAAQRRRYLGILERQTQQLLELVAQITDLARLETPELRLEQKPVELQPFLKEIVEDLKPLIDAKALVVAWEVPGSPIAVNADAGLLRRALTNILVNAIQASPPASELGIRVTRERQIALISVIDKGPGLHGDERQRIFDPYYRDPQHGGAGSPGMGLGLAITRKVVLLHGGLVSAGNLPEGGALVRVTLPLAEGE